MVKSIFGARLKCKSIGVIADAILQCTVHNHVIRVFDAQLNVSRWRQGNEK